MNFALFVQNSSETFNACSQNYAMALGEGGLFHVYTWASSQHKASIMFDKPALVQSMPPHTPPPPHVKKHLDKKRDPRSAWIFWIFGWAKTLHNLSRSIGLVLLLSLQPKSPITALPAAISRHFSVFNKNERSRRK